MGAIDDAHAAFAELGQDAVVAQCAADHSVGGCWAVPGGQVNVGAWYDTLASDTIVVHTGVMAVKEEPVRQSVTLPLRVAKQVRRMAKRRRLSASHMLVELVEEGIEAQKAKEMRFFELAKRFRAATDPNEVERLGDQLGRMVFVK